MSETIKILNIGDIHGRDSWKWLTHGSDQNYSIWRTITENGANPNDEFFNDYSYYNYDKIIFIGDYVDSFTISNVIIKKNLEDIIHFKKMLSEKVILLWGNHDIQYFIPNQICSGYRGEAKWDLNDIFTKNKDLFQMAFQYKKYLWTHAGLTKPILRALRKYEYTKGIKGEADILNECFKYEAPELFRCDFVSGGFWEHAGPLWIRPDKLSENGVDFHQIVGHTPQKKLLQLKNKRGMNIWVIDYLEYNESGEISPFVIELKK